MSNNGQGNIGKMDTVCNERITYDQTGNHLTKKSILKLAPLFIVFIFTIISCGAGSDGNGVGDNDNPSGGGKGAFHETWESSKVSSYKPGLSLTKIQGDEGVRRGREPEQPRLRAPDHRRLRGCETSVRAGPACPRAGPRAEPPWCGDDAE